MILIPSSPFQWTASENTLVSSDLLKYTLHNGTYLLKTFESPGNSKGIRPGSLVRAFRENQMLTPECVKFQTMKNNLLLQWLPDFILLCLGVTGLCYFIVSKSSQTIAPRFKICFKNKQKGEKDVSDYKWNKMAMCKIFTEVGLWVHEVHNTILLLFSWNFLLRSWKRILPSD